ncbi:MAG: MFS transporter [Paracoccaceae bacterium]
MALSPETTPDTADGDALAVWLLALGQTLGFACLYYVFAALLPAWEEAFGWSKASLAAGPTLAIVISAVIAPFAGRLVDRGLGGELLWGGALWGGLALAALALVESHGQYLLAWAAIGLGHGTSLYEVCFAFLTRRLGSGARGAIIRVTLVAGFASTLAFPMGAMLAEAFGWRWAVAGFAALSLCLSAPANGWAVARLRRLERRGPGCLAASPRGGAFRAALRRPEFWLLALVYGALSLNHSTLVAFALPLFASVGAGSALAITAASCVGPA